jgi:tetratricopeptide (TPR) repeat protein
MGEFKELNDKIEEGYGLIIDNNHPGGCDLWLEVWDEIKTLFIMGVATDVFDLGSKYDWTQSPVIYIQDLEEELQNAGIADRIYYQKRITLCEELLQWCREDETIAGNARIGIAESYFCLGDKAAAESLYAEWLRNDPEWGWGYIGWSDYYQFETEDNQYEKAEDILLAGYSREGLRNKLEIVDRLVGLYENMDNAEKADDFKAIRANLIDNELKGNPFRKSISATSAKIGRNEPCPCGSGKKYKKCCLS